jgi:hypothetical protein
MFLCPPSLIYLIFSAIQIIFDLLSGLYNTAFLKIVVSIIITILLNILCQQGLGVISWIIVFLPFLFMSVIITVLLYIFGLDIAFGPAKIETEDNTSDKCVPPPTNQCTPHGESVNAQYPLPPSNCPPPPSSYTSTNPSSTSYSTSSTNPPPPPMQYCAQGVPHTESTYAQYPPPPN